MDFGINEESNVRTSRLIQADGEAQGFFGDEGFRNVSGI